MSNCFSCVNFFYFRRDSRKLSIVAYFAPLLDSLSSSLRSEVSFNFIMAAIPYEIPWSTIAIHSIHRKVCLLAFIMRLNTLQVPNSQLLYAINGNFVALSLVKEEEVNLIETNKLIVL